MEARLCCARLGFLLRWYGQGEFKSIPVLARTNTPAARGALRTVRGVCCHWKVPALPARTRALCRQLLTEPG